MNTGPSPKIRRNHTPIDVGTELWYLIAPELGTHAITITTQTPTTIEVGG